MNKFDQIIASKLNSAEYAADETVWTSIENDLPQQRISTSQQATSFYAGIATAAILLLGLISLPTLSEKEFKTANHSDQESGSASATSAMLDSTPIHEQSLETTEYQPQENHEIELVLIESKAPINAPAKKDPVVYRKEVDNATLQEVRQPAAPKETESNTSTAIVKANYDFKATGIQCVSKSVQFESLEKAANTRWIIDGVHVLEGSKCEFIFNEEGEHEVVMMVDQNDETFSVRKSIEIFSAPSPIINHEVVSSQRCFQQSVELSSAPGSNNYSWTYNQTKQSGNNVAFSMPEGRNDVSLTAISPEGCVAEVAHQVIVEGGLRIFIPNSFTPDNDGQNDSWFAKGLEKCASFNVQVYRATDQTLVYETSELKPWNGSFQGSSEIAQRGDRFVYRITMTDECGVSTEKSGPLNSL